MHVKVLDEAVVERAKAHDIDALVYAPHFVRLPEIERRAAHFSDDDLLVLPAREVFTGPWRNRKHVLALGLSDPVPDFISLEGAMREIDRQDAAALVPHPKFLNVSFSEPDVNEWNGLVDAVETYNPKLLFGTAETAREIAENTDQSPFGSSYAHLRRSVGEVWTEFDESFDSGAAFVDALKDGLTGEVERNTGLKHKLHCLAEFAHLGWENSWQKIDRLFLQGTEPTHPRHIAYKGRFDDVAVY